MKAAFCPGVRCYMVWKNGLSSTEDGADELCEELRSVRSARIKFAYLETASEGSTKAHKQRRERAMPQICSTSSAARSTLEL